MTDSTKAVKDYFAASRELAKEQAQTLIGRDLSQHELDLLLFGYAQGTEAAHAFNQLITKLKTSK